MQEPEKDPQQCRVLRQNHKEIDRQIDLISSEEEQLRSQLDKLRSELSDINEELKDMQIILAAALIASSGRSLVAAGRGTAVNDISSKISIAKRKRDDLKANITLVVSRVEGLNNTKNRFIYDRDNFAQEMARLNCV